MCKALTDSGCILPEHVQSSQAVLTYSQAAPPQKALLYPRPITICLVTVLLFAFWPKLRRFRCRWSEKALRLSGPAIRNVVYNGDQIRLKGTVQIKQYRSDA